jgi:prefoldin subunit 1
MSTSIPQPIQEQISSLSKELSQLKGQIQQISSQIRSSEYESKLTSLTLKELSQLPKDCRCYEGIGKMFLLQDLDTLKAEIEQSSQKIGQEVQELKQVLPSFEASYQKKEEQFMQFLKLNNLVLKELK